MSALPVDLFDDVVERSPLALPPRHRLEDHYLVGRVLGHPGGFGITYLGWEGVLERRVAIKEYLPRDLVSRARDGISIVPHSSREGRHFTFGLDRFLDEARTLAALSHPNVVRIHRFFEANGTAYLVMEYHRGASLAEYLEKAGGRLPWQHAIDLALSILAGLEATHQNGILHCDIKPQNIYLTEQQQVILLDYGAARLAVTERTQTTNRVMTPGYAAWEMYLEQGELGPWTDVYSSAATLLQLLTGRRPPPAIDRLVRDPLDLAAFGLSETLHDALFRALAITPQKRIPTARAFAVELQQILAANDDSSGEVLSEALPLDSFEEATRSWRLVSGETRSPTSGASAPFGSASERIPAQGGAAEGQDSAFPSTDLSGRLRVRLLVAGAVLLALTAFFALRSDLLSEPEVVQMITPLQPEPLQSQPLQSETLPPIGEQQAVDEKLGKLVVDAAPWGNVVAIQSPSEPNLDEYVDLPCSTPCILELPVGRYTLEVRQAQDVSGRSLDVSVVEGEVTQHLISFEDLDATQYFLETGW